MKVLKTIFTDASLAKTADNESNVLLSFTVDNEELTPLTHFIGVSMKDAQDMVRELLECMENHGSHMAREILEEHFTH